MVAAASQPDPEPPTASERLFDVAEKWRPPTDADRAWAAVWLQRARDALDRITDN